MKNIFGEKVFDKNIFGKNIFFLPLPHLTALQTTPLLSSSSVIFEVECDTTENEGRNYGPDGAMFIPFIITDSNTDSLELILGVEAFFSLGHCSGALC